MIFFLQDENGFYKAYTCLQENMQIMQKNTQEGVDVASRLTTQKQGSLRTLPSASFWRLTPGCAH